MLSASLWAAAAEAKQQRRKQKHQQQQQDVSFFSSSPGEGSPCLPPLLLPGKRPSAPASPAARGQLRQEEGFGGDFEGQRLLRDFNDFALVGQGGFGRVLRARHRLDGEVYAIKVIQFTVDLRHLESRTWRYLREVQCLRRLDPSPYVVRYFSSWLETKALPLGGLPREGVPPAPPVRGRAAEGAEGGPSRHMLSALRPPPLLANARQLQSPFRRRGSSGGGSRREGGPPLPGEKVTCSRLNRQQQQQQQQQQEEEEASVFVDSGSLEGGRGGGGALSDSASVGGPHLSAAKGAPLEASSCEPAASSEGFWCLDTWSADTTGGLKISFRHASGSGLTDSAAGGLGPPPASLAEGGPPGGRVGSVKEAEKGSGTEAGDGERRGPTRSLSASCRRGPFKEDLHKGADDRSRLRVRPLVAVSRQYSSVPSLDAEEYGGPLARRGSGGAVALSRAPTKPQKGGAPSRGPSKGAPVQVGMTAAGRLKERRPRALLAAASRDGGLEGPRRGPFRPSLSPAQAPFERLLRDKKRGAPPPSSPSMRSPGGRVEVSLYIQMEFYPLSLEDFIAHTPQVDAARGAQFVSQLVQGVAFCHGRGVIHRDLKPSNMFLTRDGAVRIGDFGLALREDLRDQAAAQQQAAPQRAAGRAAAAAAGAAAGAPAGAAAARGFGLNRTRGVGTRVYAPPEQLEGRVYGSGVDIWALGLVALDLFTRSATVMERSEILQRARQGVFPEGVEMLYPRVAKFCRSCLQADPLKRPSAAQLLQLVAQEGSCLLVGSPVSVPRPRPGLPFASPPFRACCSASSPGPPAAAAAAGGVAAAADAQGFSSPQLQQQSPRLAWLMQGKGPLGGSCEAFVLPPSPYALCSLRLAAAGDPGCTLGRLGGPSCSLRELVAGSPLESPSACPLEARVWREGPSCCPFETGGRGGGCAEAAEAGETGGGVVAAACCSQQDGCFLPACVELRSHKGRWKQRCVTLDVLRCRLYVYAEPWVSKPRQVYELGGPDGFRGIELHQLPAAAAAAAAPPVAAAAALKVSSPPLPPLGDELPLMASLEGDSEFKALPPPVAGIPAALYSTPLLSPQSAAGSGRRPPAAAAAAGVSRELFEISQGSNSTEETTRAVTPILTEAKTGMVAAAAAKAPAAAAAAAGDKGSGGGPDAGVCRGVKNALSPSRGGGPGAPSSLLRLAQAAGQRAAREEEAGAWLLLLKASPLWEDLYIRGSFSGEKERTNSAARSPPHPSDQGPPSCNNKAWLQGLVEIMTLIQQQQQQQEQQQQQQQQEQQQQQQQLQEA
ncbi:hypothetical protein Efla_003512 [Eimeria flavescens]